jgi:hypothetical protein
VETLAIEYRFYVSQDLSTGELLDFMASVVGGSVVGGTFVRRARLAVTHRRMTPGEESHAARVLALPIVSPRPFDSKT